MSAKCRSVDILWQNCGKKMAIVNYLYTSVEVCQKERHDPGTPFVLGSLEVRQGSGNDQFDEAHHDDSVVFISITTAMSRGESQLVALP